VATRKRLEEETYEQYKLNLKREYYLDQMIMNGILLWDSKNGPYRKDRKANEQKQEENT
jgi:hypothetical protein